MATDSFCRGYVRQPFAMLAEEYPGTDIYPPGEFRTEWGPIFHRGRLDGTARVVVIGQDPGVHECVARRILVGAAGQRVQGFLGKLGVERGYACINAYLYCVYNKSAAVSHQNDAGIAAYRNKWLDALVTDDVEAVIAFGTPAHKAFETWKATPKGTQRTVAFAHVRHPTSPDSGGGSAAQKAKATKEMLAGWNDALTMLRESVTPETGLKPLYGDAFTPADLAEIPACDFPAGTPEWMRSPRAWANRGLPGDTGEAKRSTIAITIPENERPWREG